MPYPPVAERFERSGGDPADLPADVERRRRPIPRARTTSWPRRICEPRPITAPRPPILIGGSGERKTLPASGSPPSISCPPATRSPMSRASAKTSSLVLPSSTHQADRPSADRDGRSPVHDRHRRARCRQHRCDPRWQVGHHRPPGHPGVSRTPTRRRSATWLASAPSPGSAAAAEFGSNERDVDCLGDHQAQLLGTPSANRWMECRSRSFLRCRYRRARAARSRRIPRRSRNLGFDVTIAPAAHITYRRKLSPDHR